MALTTPTMPSAKKQKIDRQSKAAYIASQPLFDALRTATTALSNQKALLKSARDMVQALHVKVIDGDSAQHELYMKNIVASWLGITETYYDIFRQLVLLTAAVPSEGKEARGPHGHLVAILETVREAKELAQEVWIAKGDADSSDDDDNDAAEASLAGEMLSDSSSSSSPPPVQSFKSAAATSNPKVHKRPFVEEDPAEEDVAKMPKLDDTPTQAITQDHHKRKPNRPNARIRKSKILKKAAAVATFTVQAQPEPVISDQVPVARTTRPDTPLTPAPLIEYEDVEAEVNARLESKAERAAAKKARRSEKKRKRESVDSFVAKLQDGAKTESESRTVTEKQLGRPQKKKTKKEHIKTEAAADGTASNISASSSKQAPAAYRAGGAASGDESAVRSEKRKQSVQSPAIEGASGKKRKIKHAV